MKKNSKGLGAGLGALLGESVFEEENGAALLPIGQIEPREDQPRDRFDQEALSALAESIAEHGLIQPITVRRMDSGGYQIVAGERRWRASRMAGLDRIPARIIEADDQEAMELALVENLQREDLNPIEEAAGYRTLIKSYGMTQEQVAQRVGRSRPAVANVMRLLSLPDKTRRFVAEGRLAYSQARSLLELTDHEKIDEAAEKILERDMTAREAAALVKSYNTKKKSRAVPTQPSGDAGVDYAAVLGERLTRALGRRVKVSPARKGGSVTIDYYDNDDLEALIGQLGCPSED